MFIVITGLDGSGTSSIAEYLHNFAERYVKRKTSIRKTSIRKHKPTHKFKQYERIERITD